MSAFSGRQGKGAARRHKDTKRAEAEARAVVTLHENTRAHRLTLAASGHCGGCGVSA